MLNSPLLIRKKNRFGLCLQRRFQQSYIFLKTTIDFLSSAQYL